MNSSVITDAQNAIGENGSDDWLLTPEAHAAALPGEAGALRRVLLRDNLKAIMAKFKVADASAGSAQKKYRFWGRLGIYSIAAAAVIGTALILRVDESFGIETKWLALAVEYSMLLLAFIVAQWLALRRPFETWMENRGKAEILRVQLFNEVVQAKEPASERATEGELPLLPLQLEYFRRYQLDVQRSYYKGRGGQHERAAGRSTLWSFISTGLTVLWGLIAAAAFIHLAAQQGWIELPSFLELLQLENFERWIMAFGVVASSLYGASSARSLMDLDARNAARYKTTSDNLEYIAGTLLDDTRQAASAGDAGKVAAFVQLVQNQISSEHREWVMLREVAPNATLLLAQGGAVVVIGRKNKAKG